MATSGAGKSPLVALVQEVLKSAEVRASFGAARHGRVKPLGEVHLAVFPGFQL